MDGATAMLLIQAVAAIVSTAIAMSPTAADVQRRSRIDMLSKRMGLTETEQEELMSSALGAAQAGEREAFRRQGEIAATQQLTGGQLAQAQQASAERLQAGRAEASRKVLAAHMHAREQDKQELAALMGGEEAFQRGQYAAAAQGVTALAGTAATGVKGAVVSGEAGVAAGSGAQAAAESKAANAPGSTARVVPEDVGPEQAGPRGKRKNLDEIYGLYNRY
jgi:hypothetical protein